MPTLTELIEYGVDHGYSPIDVQRAFEALLTDPDWEISALFRAVTSDALAVKSEPRRTRV